MYFLSVAQPTNLTFYHSVSSNQAEGLDDLKGPLWLNYFILLQKKKKKQSKEFIYLGLDSFTVLQYLQFQ